MKRRLPLSLFFVFVLFSMLSCKKAIEKKKQEMVMDAITNGTWIIEQYLEGTTNVTGDFLDYNFQFFKDGTVTGTLSGNATSGTWSGNVSNYSITSQFPSATDPIKKLNGVWIIKDSYWDYVKAEMNTANGMNVLFLRKNP
jgi:hypothetical protein